MYEEGNRKLSFNWAGLAIKLVILAVVVFVVCLIVTRFTGNNSSSNNSLAMGNTEYITNITAMKDAAFEYFTPSKLPENVGGTEKLTLSQMLNQKLLIDFTEDGDICDINSSYVQTTKTADGNYALKVSLDCGDKSDFIVTTIEETTCTNGTCDNTTNTDVVVDDTPTDTNDDNNSGSSNTNNNNNTNSNTNSGSSTTTTGGSSSTSTKVTTTVKTTVNIKISCSTGCCYTSCDPDNGNNNNNNNDNDNNDDNNKPTDETTRWYKFVRWSDWKTGYSSDPDDENKKITTTTYDYCKDTEKTYYTTGYVTDSTKKNSTYEYEIQFLDLDPDDINDATIGVVNSSKSYFSTSGYTDYRAYLNNRGNLYMTGNNDRYNVAISNVTSYKNSSLKSNNFTFDVSGVYLSGGVYRVTVTINYKNHNGVTPYYASNLGYDVYFVPLKFDVSFAYNDDCVRDTADNQDRYDGYSISNPKKETTWMHRSPEYRWSTQKTLDGYEYTGIYEDK